jgi:hypothetical protein
MGDGDGVGGLLGLAEADEQAAINACASIHCGSRCKSASAKKNDMPGRYERGRFASIGQTA